MVEEAADVSGLFTGEWSKPQEVAYNQRDLLLYAVGIGCGQAGPARYGDLRYVYEQEPDFAAFPTYPLILVNQKGTTHDVNTPASSSTYLGLAPSSEGFSLMQDLPIKGDNVVLVDYERYCERLRAIPPGGSRLLMRTRRHGVRQRKKGVVIESESELLGDDGTVFYRFLSAVFLIGGSGVRDAGQAAAGDVAPPPRAPDHVDETRVGDHQHLIYRLSGDYNPLHIDPDHYGVRGGGFSEPILHGLCTLGHAARMVLRTCGGNDPDRFRSMKVRFSSPVLPGQTLATEMWVEGPKVIFVTKVKETGKTVISSAYVELHPQARL